MKRKLRVHVDLYSGTVEVRLVRSRVACTAYATIARIDLSRDDADERLAEARMKAKDMARQLNGLDGAR